MLQRVGIVLNLQFLALKFSCLSFWLLDFEYCLKYRDLWKWNGRVWPSHGAIWMHLTRKGQDYCSASIFWKRPNGSSFRVTAVIHHGFFVLLKKKKKVRIISPSHPQNRWDVKWVLSEWMKISYNVQSGRLGFDLNRENRKIQFFSPERNFNGNFCYHIWFFTPHPF